LLVYSKTQIFALSMANVLRSCPKIYNLLEESVERGVEFPFFFSKNKLVVSLVYDDN
jgi:hypothetical protein